MKVAVLGSGGREHAIVWKLSQSQRIKELFCLPGNPGIKQLAKCVPLPLHDHQSLIHWAKKEAISLTVVGPEDPLSNGIVDSFLAAGLQIYGPNQKAAQLESSKTFAKQIMKIYGVPTAKSASFTELLLEQCNVVVTPGTGYGEYGEGYVRLSLTTPDELVDEGVNRISKWKG